MPYVQSWLDNINRLDSRVGYHGIKIIEMKEGKMSTCTYAMQCTVCMAMASPV